MTVARGVARHPRRRRLTLLLTVIAFLIAGLGIGASPVRVDARATLGQATATPIGVYYVGPEDVIAEAIDHAAPYIVRVNQPDLAQVIVINNAPLRDTLRVFGTEIQQGRIGLVLFCGPLFPQDIEDLRALLAVSAFGLDQTAAAAPALPTAVSDPIQDAIAWRSAPEIQARTLITNPNLLRPVVATPAGEGIIQRVRGRDQTQALIVSGWYHHPSNEAWTSWAYFDYLVYHLIADAANVGRKLSFADYPPSPTPDGRERWMIAAAGTFLILGTGAIYYIARRRLYLSPILGASGERITEAASTPLPTSPATRGVSASPERAHLLPEEEEWHHVGFHRPLAGFLTYLPLSLLFFVPLIVYQTVLLPDLWRPDPHGLALWESVTLWTMPLWLLFDAGTGVAAVRQFAAHRIRAPQRASRYLQLYVWWQLISGALQVGAVCILSATAMPTLQLAHVSYLLLARAALQFPGMLSVFSVAFRAHQRFDDQQFLNLFALLSTPLLQMALTATLIPWSEATVGIGPAAAGSFGLAGGIIGAEILTFLLGAVLYHHNGHSIRALFVPSFDAATVREILNFGVPWAVGAAIPALGLLLQAEILAEFLTPQDLPTESWRLILLVAGGFEILLAGLYHSVMPMLAEAHSMAYRALLRYTGSQSMRYGAWFSFYFVAVLGAIGERVWGGSSLVAAIGPHYTTAVPWMMAMLAMGALRWIVWLPDRMLEAAGRPGVIGWLSLLEQAVRIGGGVLMIPLWGAPGLLTAYGAGLLIRAVVARIFAGRYLIKSRVYIWQTLMAPAASAFAIYHLARLVAGLLLTPVEGTWMGGLLRLGAGLLLPGLLLYAFFTALLGGWDDGSLKELDRASALTRGGIGAILTLSRPFAWLLKQSVRLGARLSPLHGRYPMSLHTWAEEEAHALTLAQMPPG